MNVNIDISDLRDVTNDIYYPLYDNRSRRLLLYGSTGSGKSYFATKKILVRILAGMSSGIKHKFLAIRKTQPAIRRSVFQLLRDYITQWGLNEICTINKSEMSFTFLGGSQILCIGLDDPEKLKSIEGITSIWIEEATEISRLDFNQIDIRIRGEHKAYEQIILSFNPIDKLNWIYEYFFENKVKDCTILKTTYKDNRFLKETDKEKYEAYKDIDAYFHMVYALGEWGVRANIIYPGYETFDKWQEGSRDNGEYVPYYDEEIYGLDFGFNKPNALVHIGFKDTVPYVRELIYETKQTTPMLIERMKEVIPERNRNKYIYADDAEPDRIEEIRLAGFNIHPAEKSVDDGIMYVKTVKLHIHSGSPNLIKEMDGYKYKEDKDGNVLEEPVKFNNHLMDAKRYALYTYHIDMGGIPRITVL